MGIKVKKKTKNANTILKCFEQITLMVLMFCIITRNGQWIRFWE